MSEFPAVPGASPPPPKAQPLLLRIDDAAFEASLSRRSIFRLITKGELKAVKCGNATRVTRASLLAFIQKGGSK